MNHMLTDIKRITVHWLTDRLRQNGHLDQGEVASFEVQSGNPASNPVCLLKLTYSSDATQGAPRSLFLKLLQGGGSAHREGVFYKILLPLISNPPVPKCYDVVMDEERKCGHLLLENLSHSHTLPLFPNSNPEEEAAGFKKRLKSNTDVAYLFEHVIDALLRIQTALWENPLFQEPLINNPFLGETTHPEKMIQSCRHLQEKTLPKFVDRYQDRLKKAYIEISNRIISSWPQLYTSRTATGKALTFAQTDFHIHNVFYPNDPHCHPVHLIDFEDYSLGIGLIPVVQFLITSPLSSESRRVRENQMLTQYHNGLMKSGILDYSWDDCERDYRLSIMANIGRELLVGRVDAFEKGIEMFSDWECMDILN